MSKRERQPLRKGYCITTNNPTEDEERRFHDIKFTYSIFGREKAPNTGTAHLQGYVHYAKQVRFNNVKADFPNSHITVANGTAEQNQTYCKKENDYVEFGELPKTGGQANAERYIQAKKLAQEGDLEQIDSQIYIQNYNTLKRIKSDHAPKIPSIDTLDNEWHFGPTGTGKSRTVRTQYPDAFIKDANKWWDGYQNEDIIIIEDVDIYDKALGRLFKLWGDHYSFPADSKLQGKTDIRPKKIIVTSNYTPQEIWEDSKTHDPINRRYKLVQYKLPVTL